MSSFKLTLWFLYIVSLSVERGIGLKYHYKANAYIPVSNQYLTVVSVPTVIRGCHARHELSLLAFRTYILEVLCIAFPVVSQPITPTRTRSAEKTIGDRASNLRIHSILYSCLLNLLDL